MTDDKILAPDGTPAEAPKQLIEVDAQGDPIRQGTLMLEKESYERVIEGLRMISDSCAHLIKHEPESADVWRGYLVRFDKARLICVQYARLGLTMKEKETGEVRGDPLPWKECRQRFLDGVIQAAGGCRQLATCHRGDMWWTRMADVLDEMARKLRGHQALAKRKALAARMSLILPEHLTRQ
jgi:hypothetical protein